MLDQIIKTLYTCKEPLMVAYEWSKSTCDNYGKFIHQFLPEPRNLSGNMKGY